MTAWTLAEYEAWKSMEREIAEAKAERAALRQQRSQRRYRVEATVEVIGGVTVIVGEVVEA